MLPALQAPVLLSGLYTLGDIAAAFSAALDKEVMALRYTIRGNDATQDLCDFSALIINVFCQLLGYFFKVIMCA